MMGQRDKAPHAPWPMVRLGDVCEVQRGGSPRPIKDYITDSPLGLNWIKIGDVDPTGKYITHTDEKIKESGLNKTRRVASGDFLLSNSMSFGRPYILKIDGCIHDGWLVLKGFSKTFTEDFFYYLLRSPVVQEQFDKLAHGSTVRNLNTDAVSQVLLPLPPLSVQREIVARLERELAAVEKMKKGFEALAETAKAEFKAELKEVFEEISRGGAEMRRLGDVCELKAGGDKPTAFSKCVSDTMRIPVVSNGIQNEGICGYTNVATEHAGCVTVSARGTIGWPCIRDYSFVPIVRLIVVRPKDEVDVGYLLRILQQLSFNQSGSSIPQLTVPMLKGIEIPLPSLPVQRQIVARLSAAKTRAEKLEAKAQEGVAICETMRKAILKEAFE